MLRRLFLIAAALCACLPLAAQNEASPARTISKVWDIDVPVFSVSVHGDPQAKTLAVRALSTHGSFKIVPTAGQYEFDFAKASDTSVTLTINASKPYTQTVSGKTYADAVARACDVIVRKVLGQPGYFAGQIAFVSDRSGSKEIYTSDFLFQTIRALTADNSDSMLPHWSPDGTKILYTGYYRTKLMDLYEINLSTHTRRTFASYKGTNTGGAFSPDGRNVALILSTTGNAEIWRADKDGRNLKRLTKNKSVEASASWSPDGSELIFSSDAMGSPQIYRMSVSGGNMQRVHTKASGYCTEPVWNSVDKTKIAFTTARDAGFQIAVYDFNKKESRVITSGGSASLPKWLNDGRHIIFTKNYGKARALYIVDSLTGKQTALHSEKIGNCGEADFIYPNR